ncbi:MAG: 6-phospho-3-hexuloisomerase [Halobacteriota archaeon]|nr:6-phospho-3-hexuloisomerase [Halobacteriota archaeon]
MKGVLKLPEENVSCNSLLSCINVIVDHISETADRLDKSKIEEMIGSILKANRIFVMGAGRSGLVARAFAMRLMHLGFTAFVVGEPTTPGVKDGDLIIAISGSGETLTISGSVKVAKDIGAELIAVTSNPNSTIGSLADIALVVEGRTKNDVDENYLERQMRGDYKSLTPLGTMFEITSLVVLDAIVAELMTLTGLSEADLKSRHASLE